MNIRKQIGLTTSEWIALVLVTIGAINWGLVGLAGFIGANLNLVDLVFGAFPTVENLVYLVIGLAGLYVVYVGYRLNSGRPVSESVTSKRAAK
jgi:uncharacterized membrane protein YuzA (DUF378 family)